jgi:hypothetical protein
MNYARYLHTPSILANGNVLVAGGYNSSGYLNSTELYDPSTGVWTIIGSITYTRTQHTASVLTNGQVLVTGGTFSVALNSSELYQS